MNFQQVLHMNFIKTIMKLINQTYQSISDEPSHEKTCFLHMRKQSSSSAAQ